VVPDQPRAVTWCPQCARIVGVTQPSFAELLAMPGVVEECELRGRFGFMAYHGGALEEMTDVIAREAARQSDSSYYGVLQPDTLLVHLPSIRVTPAHSPALSAFLDHVDVVITVHGFGRRPLFTSILLGGRNRRLAAHLADRLRPVLPDYDIVDDVDRIPVELQGMHARNPVNLPPDAGVQLELPPRARGCGPVWKDWEAGLVPPTRALVAALAEAASAWGERPTADRGSSTAG
jgi:phage replication-related protein YjqB (UPF0714/DUF867 family)